jgi:23S rRNA (guanosine2251-2'-O)-methyltransferase
MQKKSMSDLQRMTVEDFRVSAKNPLVLVLDNVRSMQNVGSVFRTADAFLLEAIYLCGYTPRPPHRDIQKTALGATETVAWQYFPSTAEAIEQLSLAGYETWAVEQVQGSIALQDLLFSQEEKIALVFGNEAEGVQQEILPLCKGSIEIPQMGTKHSLNISVAVGVVLWELCRERMPSPEVPGTSQLSNPYGS